MRIHHTKHHQAYVNNANDALKGTEFENASVEEVLKNLDKLPENIRGKVRNNAGGHFNHSVFWEIMSPNGGGEPTGALGDAITAKWGSFSDFKEKFKAAATGQFGSGWAWLVVKNGELEIVGRPNQDAPVMDGLHAIIGIDVWEHAYYLKYQNKRPDYVGAWWNVVNWEEAGNRYSQAKG